MLIKKQANSFYITLQARLGTAIQLKKKKTNDFHIPNVNFTRFKQINVSDNVCTIL